MRNKKLLIVILSVTVCTLLFGYLWYAHAAIYWQLGDQPIFAPSDYASYSIGLPSAASLTYVAIGDSLTAGVGVDSYEQSYPYLIGAHVAETTKKEVRLVPFAIPGIRSEYVAGYFLEPVILSKPDIVTVFIGTNDIHGNVSLEKFKEHYTQILFALTEKTDAAVYAVNLPYIGTQDLILQPYRWYLNHKTQQYNTIIQELATEHNVTYVDLYSSHKPHALDTSYYAQDFFHPNETGYALWAETIYASLHN